MNKRKICEAMYALPGEVVVRRRKSLAIPALLLAAGVAMLVLNHVSAADLSNNLSSALVFVGGILALVGALLLCMGLFGSDGVPYHRAGHCYLRYDELYFDRAELKHIVQHVADGQVERLVTMPHARVPAVAVALYRTPDNRFAAMQAFEYADLEYKPLTELKIVGGEAGKNLNNV